MYNLFRLFGVTVLALTVSLFFLYTAAVASSLTGCGGAVIESSNIQFEQQVVELVNQERAAVGLPPLKFNPTLTNAARYLAQDMALDDYFAHDTYDRIDDQLVRICQWTERVTYYYSAPMAENVAAGFSSPTTVMQGWMDSQGHRTNILNNAWEIGVGYYDAHWVQDFGKQSDVYPLIINSEALTTASLEVELYIYGDWEQIRLRNDGGEWSAWQPFQAQLPWPLNPGAGIHTVEAEMQNSTTTASNSDEIEVISMLVSRNETTEPFVSSIFLPILHR